MARDQLNVLDLVGAPHVEHGCMIVMGRVLERLGFDVREEDLPSGSAGLIAVQAMVNAERSPWVRIGGDVAAATQLGDVVLVRVGPVSHHVYTVVDTDGRRAITSEEDRGVGITRLGAVAMSLPVVGVYRHRFGPGVVREASA